MNERKVDKDIQYKRMIDKVVKNAVKQESLDFSMIPDNLLEGKDSATIVNDLLEGICAEIKKNHQKQLEVTMKKLQLLTAQKKFLANIHGLGEMTAADYLAKQEEINLQEKACYQAYEPIWIEEKLLELTTLEDYEYLEFALEKYSKEKNTTFNTKMIYMYLFRKYQTLVQQKEKTPMIELQNDVEEEMVQPVLQLVRK